MPEGMQITIPDFDEDEYSTTPIPFGRSGGHPFGFGGGNVPGQDSSPTTTTSLGFSDRGDKNHYFSHSREDSVTSDDSTHSITRYTSNKNATPFGHSSHQSIATTSPAPITKKSSFASIRNAFKSSKNHDPPPLPQVDHRADPVLKNPFNRSTSSLNHGMASSRPFGPNSTSPYPRPPTPGSSVDARFAKGTLVKAKGQPYGKPQHSHSGSTFHNSDIGSDYNRTHAPASPPPVPRVPNAFGGRFNSSETLISEVEDDKIVMDPRTPSEYALHAVFMRFATSAELKIDVFLRHGLDQDPLLPDSIGPGVDTKFDELLESLGKIAQKHTKPVVDSIMRWRRTHNEPVGTHIVRHHASQSPVSQRNTRTYDIPAILNERKSLASIYIMCRALIVVLRSISKDALGETLGYSLEETTFEQFRRPDLKLLAQSANHRTNAELYATLLGCIANVRFVSVADRFLGDLGPVASGQVPKDLDMKYESLVKGIKYIQIKVWPPEAFEEGAEFLESLTKSFVNAHGLRLKTAFAETLVCLLHQIGKTAQAEVNHPQWGKAIESIHPKVKEMMAKPRYWHVAYPLLITSLCVAPHQFFLKNWCTAFDAGIPKLKEKQYRIPVMNGMLRLIWTYLYRCQDSPSMTISKLEPMLKHFFPANRLNVFPNDDQLDPFIYIVHYVLSRHIEFGRDLCLELIQESTISSLSGTAQLPLAPERTAIAIEAILLSLHAIEKEIPTPTWPSSPDFSVIPSREDYPISSDFVPPSIMSKPGMQQFFDRCGTTLAIVAMACSSSIGSMSIADDQWSFPRPNIGYEETLDYTIRKHGDHTVAYSSSLSPQISLLRTCFQGWPRCLHPTIPLGDAIDMLIRGVIHVEPSLGEAATGALKRLMADPQFSLNVMSRYTNFLFSPQRTLREGSGVKLLPEIGQLLDLWIDLVQTWVHDLRARSRDSLADDEKSILARIDEIEAGSLFLLSYEIRSIRLAGIAVFRLLGHLLEHVSSEPPLPPDSQDTSSRIVDMLHGKGLGKSYLYGFDELLDGAHLGRLEQWRQTARADIPLRIADSTNDKDRRLFRTIFPRIIFSSSDARPLALPAFRENLVAAVSRYHPTILSVAGLSNRAPVGLPARPNAIDREGSHSTLICQWHMWVKILCSTATLSEPRSGYTPISREHTRSASDPSFERERLTTSRGLFRYLTPFLDSERTCFRDAAVLCISCLPSSAYPQLLEDLSLLAARQFYDESRSKTATGQVLEQNLNSLAARPTYDDPRLRGILPDRSRRQERFYSAVARIYYLTAQFLQHQRSAGRPAALARVLKFVRNTQAFLTTPEVRDNFTFHRLRRYFCGTVERLFDDLNSLKDSDRFIPSNMHLTLYRLCEEWCQLGPQSDIMKQRFLFMQRASVTAPSNSNSEQDLAERFQRETVLLSNAAVGALASLAQKALFPPEISSSSPTDRPVAEHLKPLGLSAMLDRWSAILSSSQPIIQDRAKKALRSLLIANTHDTVLREEFLRRALVTSKQLDSSSGRLFELISDIICTLDDHGFSFSQVLCLGLSNLCHPDFETRRLAFNILEGIHDQCSGILSMSQLEVAVGSTAPSTHLHAPRLVSDFLAGEHIQESSNVLSQVSYWLQHNQDISPNTSLLLLQGLESWIPNIELMTADKTALSREGGTAIYHLIALTLRFCNTHPEQISALWNRLVDPPHQSNGHATVRFLLEQSHKVGSTVFVDCAANVVACLCETSIGKQIFEELSSVIEPARMLPTIDHKLSFPNADDMELWSDLDALFAEQPRLQLSAAQFALLFLADAALDRQWEQQTHLPILLHAIFVHLDHRVVFVRQQARRMLFQLLRSWIPGYNELPDRADRPTRSTVKLSVHQLEREATAMYWKEDETSVQSEPKMKWLCKKVLSFFDHLAPKLAEEWGSVALDWGTACSIRATAFRSLQIFRALMPRVTKAGLAVLLGRLSNTIAAPDENIQSFTSEITRTLTSLAVARDPDVSLLPQLFWCACAGLSTTVESEFSQILRLLDAVISRVDFDDPEMVDLLLSNRPSEWTGCTSLQPSLLPGLRSSVTVGGTMKILKTLAKFEDGQLINPSEGRVRDLYTASLPWCLQAMISDSPDESLQEFATDIGRLAKKEGRDSIERIMTSFAKSRFRTKDDFLRQSVASLREHYGVDHWTQVVTLLLGLVLNSERWLRVQSMQILKVLFQQRETRNPVGRLGSELLMPLLRLLETDLASQALEVLEEPMTISGGPSAKHVLRMSMHINNLGNDSDSVANVFGPPEESGWSVAQPDTLREACRANVMAVFDTCKMPLRPSRIDFEPESEILSDMLGENLGDLVQNLHELTTFFQADEHAKIHIPLPAPSHQVEARVAAILAKATTLDLVVDVPPTPFLDVFKVGVEFSDESAEESGSDSESDAFIFDSPTNYSAPPIN